VGRNKCVDTEHLKRGKKSSKCMARKREQGAKGQRKKEIRAASASKGINRPKKEENELFF